MSGKCGIMKAYLEPRSINITLDFLAFGASKPGFSLLLLAAACNEAASLGRSVNVVAGIVVDAAAAAVTAALMVDATAEAQAEAAWLE